MVQDLPEHPVGSQQGSCGICISRARRHCRPLRLLPRAPACPPIVITLQAAGLIEAKCFYSGGAVERSTPQPVMFTSVEPNDVAVLSDTFHPVDWSPFYPPGGWLVKDPEIGYKVGNAPPDGLRLQAGPFPQVFEYTQTFNSLLCFDAAQVRCALGGWGWRGGMLCWGSC
jgi:hypothetical protein